MKQFFLFLLIVITTNLFSQIDSTYVPFPTDSVAWNETSCGWINGPYDISCTNKFFFLIGDTIIDSLSYSKVYEGKEIFNIHANHTYLRGGLREENKKVYFKSFENSGEPEKLYYDFTLNIGDTVWWEGDYCCRLERFDSIQMVDGSFRKKYIYETNSFPMEIVEGVGNIAHNSGGLLLPNSTFIFENTNALSCVVKPGKEIYIENFNSSLDYNCYEISVPIKEIEENNILIYPNPFENILNFTEKLYESKVVVYSISGKRVFEKTNFSGSTLDLHFLEKGIYYLKVATEKSYYQKIVKL